MIGAVGMTMDFDAYVHKVLNSNEIAQIQSLLDRRLTALAQAKEVVNSEEGYVTSLKAKLADLAGTAPVPADTPIHDVSEMTQALRDRPARKVIT